MQNKIICLRCEQEMKHIGQEKFQLGQTGWILGNLPNLLAGAMEVDLYHCSACGKLEFFSTDVVEEELPQKQCPNCGRLHDFDYPKCPSCKYDYHTYRRKNF